MFPTLSPHSSLARTYYHSREFDHHHIHLCQNRAFVDGNKRAAAFSTALFLALHGIPDAALPLESELERIAFAVVRGEMSKTEITLRLQSLSVERSRLLTSVVLQIVVRALLGIGSADHMDHLFVRHVFEATVYRSLT